MGAEDFIAIMRDFALIVFSLVTILVMIIGSVTMFLEYRKISPILEDTKRTIRNTQEATSQISENVVKPLRFVAPIIGTSTLTVTAGRIFSLLLGLSSRKRGGDDGK